MLSPIQRRVVARAGCALFSTQFVLLDVCFRGVRTYVELPRLLANASVSIALLYFLWTIRSRLLIRMLVAVLVATLMSTQSLFFRYYHAPIDTQVVASAVHSWTDVRRALGPMGLRISLLIFVVTTLEILLLTRGLGESERVSTHRLSRFSALSIGVFSALVAMPLREGTPDLRLLDALRLFHTHTEHGGAAGAAHVPVLSSVRSVVPNVLFILTESVRASDYCSDPSAACPVAPEVHRLTRGRIPLRQMRAVSSYTAVSMSALTTGRTQEAKVSELLVSPNLFQLLSNIRGAFGRPRVLYWASQSESVFENKDVRSVVDSFVTLETLTGRRFDEDPVDTGFDRLLVDHALRNFPKAQEPYFLMLHFFGTHAPYFVDRSDAPYQPWNQEVTWSGMPALRNAYRNAIHEQDKGIAACIRAFVKGQGARPWVIVFTSDHGEAFGEHGAIHHGQNLYDEQLHVPAWIATSPGALEKEQEANLRAYSDGYVTHLDVLPTLLDLYGVLDGFAMRPVREKLAGRSLLRPLTKMAAPLPITNCTDMFPCPVNTWGMMKDEFELHAQVWDADWKCLNLAGGTLDPACSELREASKSTFERKPNRQLNR